MNNKYTFFFFLYLPALLLFNCSNEKEAERPNILIAISDDQSWPHASAYGTDFVQTPNFDRVAEEGILFHNAIVTSPGCAPSRGSIALGRYPWQNEHAGSHNTVWPKKFKTLADYLMENDYQVGYTGKGVGPFAWALGGRTTNPAGPVFEAENLEPPYDGISSTDYSANFDYFLSQINEKEPFFFWYGAHEPHRRYEYGSGEEEGKAITDEEVPAFLPVTDTVKNDLLDYALEIEWFDKHLGQILQIIENKGMMENTLIFVTADNGMPFPAAKANCYEYGIHVPLAVKWGARIKSGRQVEDVVSLADIFPTLFEIVDLELPQTYPVSGKSMTNLLYSDESGKIDENRNAVYASRERHSSARYANLGYPQRAIRTDQYLLIRNYKPERWPAGAPEKFNEEGEKVPAYHDIDYGPTLQYYIDHQDDPSMKPFVKQALSPRPFEELYDIIEDPACQNNLSNDPEFKTIKDQLSKQLSDFLIKTEDPREVGPDKDIFETHPRYFVIRDFPEPDWKEDLDQEYLKELISKVGKNDAPVVPPDEINEGEIILGKWHMIEKNGGWQLYDRVNDPDLTNDLSKLKGDVVGSLQQAYGYWREKD